MKKITGQIPFLKPNATIDKLEVNAMFVSEVAKLLGYQNAFSATVILICTSGIHAAIGAEKLADAGFTGVYTIVGGYDGSETEQGWRASQAMTSPHHPSVK